VPKTRAAIFLDRDGTLNHDPGYIGDPAKLHLLPGAGEAVARLKKMGFLLVVVSNQSGVARGLVDPAVIPELNARLNVLLEEAGGHVDHFEFCFHHPRDHCDCRKPKPLLLTHSAELLGINLGESYMVGDKKSDVLAGRRAGCRGSFLVRTGEGAKEECTLDPGQASGVFDDLGAFVDFLSKQEV